MTEHSPWMIQMLKRDPATVSIRLNGVTVYERETKEKV